MGMPEYAEFLDLADRYPRVHLDTTMAFTDFAEAVDAVPDRPATAAARAAGPDPARIRLPEHALSLRPPGRGLSALDLGDDWLRSVLHDNAARLLAGKARPRLTARTVCRSTSTTKGVTGLDSGCRGKGSGPRKPTMISLTTKCRKKIKRRQQLGRVRSRCLAARASLSA